TTSLSSVEALIDSIGTDFTSEDFAEKAAQARAAYESLKPAQQALVENYDKLLAAEAAVADLNAANDVIDLIDTIGTVEYTDECKEKIDAAKAAYNNLTAEQKELVTNYTTLTAAESTYALVEAKAQLTSAINEAKAFYESIKDDEKYAEIANAVKTAYERGEAALASEDAAEVLDFADNVEFALTTAQADKEAIDTQSSEPVQYTVTVPEGCTVSQTDVAGVEYKLGTIIAPETNAAGDKFVYWTDNYGNIVSTYRTYHFYVGCDADYTPVYASDADYETMRADALITSRVINVTYGADGLIFLGEHSVSKSADLNGHGILITTSADAATAQTLVTGSDSDDVYDFQAQTTKNSKTGMLQVTAALVADTVWARTYVVDGNGDVHYGQIQSYNVSELDEHSFDEEIIELDAQNEEEIAAEDEPVEEAAGFITILFNIIKTLLEKLDVILKGIISIVK
ncbi:MAG: hypothetical protein IJU45_07430, partial [Clostridia bacterium]|nr:hypothetical protein [Clostridia bacterium]